MKKNIQETQEMITKFLKNESIENSVYNSENHTWSFQSGSITIEVGITLDNNSDNEQYYLHLSSPMKKTPTNNQQEFFKKILELNDQSQSLKLLLLPNTDLIFLAFDCRIQDINYERLQFLVSDMEVFAYVVMYHLNIY